MLNPCLDSNDLIPALIALLALASAGSLAYKAVIRRETIIWSAVLPRVYLFAIYFYFVIFDQGIEFRQGLARFGFIVLLFVENVNHLLYWINQRHA